MTHNTIFPSSAAAVSDEDADRTMSPDLSRVSLIALGQCDDDEFEQAAADVLDHLDRPDSSVAGHSS